MSVLVEVHLLEEKIWWVVSLSVLAAGSALRASDAISHLLSGTGLDSCLNLSKTTLASQILPRYNAAVTKVLSLCLFHHNELIIASCKWKLPRLSILSPGRDKLSPLCSAVQRISYSLH